MLPTKYFQKQAGLCNMSYVKSSEPVQKDVIFLALFFNLNVSNSIGRAEETQNTATLPMLKHYMPFMRDPKRIKPFLEIIEQFWTGNPDFRFGQLILAITKTGEHNPNLFNMEEEEFLEKINEFKKQLNSR